MCIIYIMIEVWIKCNEEYILYFLKVNIHLDEFLSQRPVSKSVTREQPTVPELL